MHFINRRFQVTSASKLQLLVRSQDRERKREMALTVVVLQVFLGNRFNLFNAFLLCFIQIWLWWSIWGSFRNWAILDWFISHFIQLLRIKVIRFKDSVCLFFGKVCILIVVILLCGLAILHSISFGSYLLRLLILFLKLRWAEHTLMVLRVKNCLDLVMLNIWIQSLVVLFLNWLTITLSKWVLTEAWHRKPWELWRVTMRCQMRSVCLEIITDFWGVCDLMCLRVGEIWLFRRIWLYFLHTNQRQLTISASRLAKRSRFYCTCMILRSVRALRSEVLLETSLIKLRLGPWM